MAFPKDCDLVISVGAGTINDLGRYASYITGRDFILVLTAPSMDGAVSGVAPLIQNHLKITFPAHAPVALVGDLDILSKAPMKMLSAGVGDILGKYNCLTDWRLSALVNGEYHCATIEGIMRSAIDKTMQAARKLTERSEDDIRTLTEGLVLSGIAMDFAGNSRPASGAEHHISHFFEMQFLFDGIPAILHGTKVGVATITVKGTGKNTTGTYKKTFVVKPAKNAIKTISSTKGAFKITWTKATAGATGYQVEYSTDKNFAKNVHSYTSTNLSDLSENFSSVPKSGETWYVKVRSFVTKDGKATSTRYGNYSDVKTIKIK